MSYHIVGGYWALIPTRIESIHDVSSPSPLSASSPCSYPSVERFDASAVGLYDIPDAPYLLELGLQLFDLSQNLLKAGYFGVGRVDDIAGTVVLRLRRNLRLLVELFDIPLLVTC